MSNFRSSEPLTLYLDWTVQPEVAFLVDDLDPDKPAKENFPPRREYLQFAELSPEERLEAWHEGRGNGAPPLEEFVDDIPPLSQWTAEQRAELDAYEQAQSAWLDEEVDIFEMEPRDLAVMT
ncbi:MAG: hypothetical protein WAM94_01870, partial [Chromatiaceae bacterium]